MTTQTVREIGEFGLIAALEDVLPKAARASNKLRIGIGDDAAVWRPPRGEEILVTTDSLVEGVHFRLDWTDWRSFGHKALAVNISDIAAMGGEPKLATISLGLRRSERVEDLQKLYRGIGTIAVKNNTIVAGGDIVSSPHSLGIHITIIGSTRFGGKYLTRSGAQPGDLVAVSGTLGASAAGLRLLREGEASPRRQASTADLLIRAHLLPEPRVRLGIVLIEHGASAAMDLSDGLLGDLPKILHASSVAARLNEADIPVAAAVRSLFPDDWFELASRGGEDYELLFTAPPNAIGAIARHAERAGSTITVIGEVVERTPAQPLLTMIGINGIERQTDTGAFDHFR